MHVLALNGSPRQGNTHRVIQEIADLLRPHGIDVRELSLARLRIDDCVGCERCIRETSACVLPDDAGDILDLLTKADGLILASPVYVMQVPGRLKSLIDKTASWVHRPPLAGVPTLLVGTTAGSGLGQTLSYLEQVAVQWGAFPTGRIGRTVTDRRPVQAREVGRFLWHLRHPRAMYRPSAQQVLFFQVQKTLALKVSALDRAYWTERGWHTAPYYYACRLSWALRLLGSLMSWILDWRVRPGEHVLGRRRPVLPHIVSPSVDKNAHDGFRAARLVLAASDGWLTPAASRPVACPRAPASCAVFRPRSSPLACLSPNVGVEKWATTRVAPTVLCECLL